MKLRRASGFRCEYAIIRNSEKTTGYSIAPFLQAVFLRRDGSWYKGCFFDELLCGARKFRRDIFGETGVLNG